MTELSMEQIRYFRLRSHHLDGSRLEADAADAGTAADAATDIVKLVGACGMQNTPPGAWETALFNRVPHCSLCDTDQLLYQDKSLIQSWSLRGAPVVFPASESAVFLSALMPEPGEPWIYTQGISLALDYLHMGFDECLDLLRQVIPRLDGTVIASKCALDQTIAQWMLPLLSKDKQRLWNQPSMYGQPEVQTVGGAAVSFLLRPCAFMGLVVFAERTGASPCFTSYKGWTGGSVKADADATRRLVRKYLHCFGPATADMFAGWLGCSGRQARRMWNMISEEMEPVTVLGKKAFILSADREHLLSPPPPRRELLLLGGHDPFLDQRDRLILQPDPSLHKQIWKMVTNPGAILYRGEIIGIWTSKKHGKGVEIKAALWKGQAGQAQLRELAEEYAAFRRQRLIAFDLYRGPYKITKGDIQLL